MRECLSHRRVKNSRKGREAEDLREGEGGKGRLSKITKGQLMGELVHPCNDFSFTLRLNPWEEQS